MKTFSKVTLLSLAAMLGMAGLSQAEDQKIWEVALTGGQATPGNLPYLTWSWFSDRRGGVVIAIDTTYPFTKQIVWIGATGKIIYQDILPVGPFDDAGIQGVGAASGLFIATHRTEYLTTPPYERVTTTMLNISRAGKKTVIPGVVVDRFQLPDPFPNLLDGVLVDEAGYFSFHAAAGPSDTVFKISVQRFFPWCP